MNVQSPTDLIFFVTSRCHLQCSHCFNWQNLRRDKDLSLKEIELLAQSLPRLKTLMISGGEPFLRTDLADICQVFARHGQIKLIDIPTSGTLIDSTVATVKRILAIEPSFNLTIGISLDGMENYHDSNRGVPGTFAKAVECCTELLKIKRTTNRLSVIILTTLVHDNKDELLALKKFVEEKFPGIDNLAVALARGNTKEGNLSIVSPDDLACIDKEFLNYNFQNHNRQRAISSRLNDLRCEAFMHNVQPVPCVAGGRIAVVYDDGGVAPCELLPTAGNLRDVPFGQIWGSQEMGRVRAEIAAGKCSCTHECFLSPSFETYLLNRPFELIKLLGADGFKQIIVKKCHLSEIARKSKKILNKLGRRH